MTEKRSKLQAQYASTRARLHQADDDVRRTSRARLTELMNLPPGERLAHLRDPALTTEDSASLERSVAAQLSRPRSPAVRHTSTNRLGIQLGCSLTSLAVNTVVMVPLCLWAALAWSNTATLYEVGQPLDVKWKYPSGAIRPYTIAPGVKVPLVHRWGTTSYFRYWVAGQGYLTAKADAIETDK
jgi:hypothetical protein